MTTIINAVKYYALVSVVPPPGAVHPVSQLLGRIAVINRREAIRDRGRTIYETSYEPAYTSTNSGGKTIFTFGVGLLPEVREGLDRLGYHLDLKEVEPAGIDGMQRLIPNMERVESINWREDQRDIVDDILDRYYSQYQLSTGAGKSYMISRLCEVFDRANIIITTPSIQLVEDMYREILSLGRVDVGVYHSKRKQPEGRVIVCATGSLSHFSHRDWDILIVDEKHEFATLQRMEQLFHMNCRRAYAFSANDNDRMDGADRWLETVFGRTQRKIVHRDSVAAGDIVPVRVKWVPMEIPRFRSYGSGMNDLHSRCLYRDNTARNQKVAQLLDEYAEQGQTLAYVSKVEHAYRIRKFTDCPVAHGVRSAADWDKLRQLDLVTASEKNPTAADMAQLKSDFSAGKIRKAICNSVWDKGVNFPQLMTLIRGDASTSVADATQISGRLTRKYEGKEYGLLVDFDDIYDDVASNRSERRKAIYKKLGYDRHRD